jgi:hypothetical protein
MSERERCECGRLVLRDGDRDATGHCARVLAAKYGSPHGEAVDDCRLRTIARLRAELDVANERLGKLRTGLVVMSLQTVAKEMRMNALRVLDEDDEAALSTQPQPAGGKT